MQKILYSPTLVNKSASFKTDNPCVDELETCKKYFIRIKLDGDNPCVDELETCKNYFIRIEP